MFLPFWCAVVCIVAVCASGLRLWDTFLLFARERILLRFKNFLFAMESLLQQRGLISRVADSGARLVPGAAPFARAPRNASLSVHLKRNVDMSLECVRFMGIGSWKEGNRGGQQGVRYLQATLDGISSENPEVSLLQHANSCHTRALFNHFFCDVASNVGLSLHRSELTSQIFVASVRCQGTVSGASEGGISLNHRRGAGAIPGRCGVWADDRGSNHRFAIRNHRWKECR